MFSSFRNFCISFVIASVLFSSVGYAITEFLGNTMDDILNPIEDIEAKIADQSTSPETTSPEESTSSTVDPTVIETLIGEDFTLLVAVTDYDPVTYSDYLPDEYNYEDLVMKYGINSDASFLKEYRYPEVEDFILIHADKENQRYEILPISSNLKVDCATYTSTFGSTYHYYSKYDDPMGYQFISEKIYMLTGWVLTDIIEIHAYRLAELLEITGSLSITLPCNIYSNSVEYFTMIPADVEYEPGMEPYFYLTKGKNEVNANNILPILFISERYETDVRNKSDILSNVTEAFLNYFSSKSSDDLISYYLLLTDTEPPADPSEETSEAEITEPDENPPEINDPQQTEEIDTDSSDITTDPETIEEGDQTSEKSEDTTDEPSDSSDDESTEIEEEPLPETHSVIQTSISYERLLSQMDLFQKFSSYSHIILRYPYTYELNEDGTIAYVVSDLISAHSLFFQYR